MKKIFFVSLSVTSLLAIAGLPPTSSKVSGDSVFKLTTQTDYGNMTATRSGGKITITQTGTGAQVLATSPALVTPNIGAANGTSLTAPTLIGGTGATSTLTLKPTSGVGTAGSDIIFGVGSNGATEAMRIKSDGKIGVGTSSPSYKFQVQSHVTDPVSNNANFRATARNTDTASNAQNQYGILSEVSTNVSAGFTNSGSNIGVYSIAVTPSGSTGTGTTTQLMGVRSDYGIQTGGDGTVTSAYGLYSNLYGQAGTIANAYGLYLASPNTGGTITNEWGIYSNSSTAKNYFAGAVGVGSTSFNAYEKIRFGGNLTGSTAINAVTNTVAIQSDVTSNVSLYNTFPSTQASAFTLSALNHFTASQGTVGAGSSITEQVGFIVGSSLTGATTNIGFKGNLAEATGRYNFYAAGTAQNYFAGNTGIGIAPTATERLKVAGNITAFTTGIESSGTVTVDGTSATMFQSMPSISGTTYVPSLIHYQATKGTNSAGATVGTQIGFGVDGTLTRGTTNYAFFSAMPDAADNWSFFSSDTANNSFKGKTVIGSNNVPTSSLEVLGSMARRVTSSATGTTLDITHSTFILTATGQTVTLPTANGILGREYTIKLTAAGTGTINTTSSQTIDGATTYSLSAQYKYVTVVSNGVNWLIVGNN